MNDVLNAVRSNERSSESQMAEVRNNVASASSHVDELQKSVEETKQYAIIQAAGVETIKLGDNKDFQFVKGDNKYFYINVGTPVTIHIQPKWYDVDIFALQGEYPLPNLSRSPSDINQIKSGVHGGTIADTVNLDRPGMWYVRVSDLGGPTPVKLTVTSP